MKEPPERACIISVPFDKLGEAIGLPEGHEIVALAPLSAASTFGRTLEVIVTGPNAPLVGGFVGIPNASLRDLTEPEDVDA